MLNYGSVSNSLSRAMRMRSRSIPTMQTYNIILIRLTYLPIYACNTACEPMKDQSEKKVPHLPPINHQPTSTMKGQKARRACCHSVCLIC